MLSCLIVSCVGVSSLQVVEQESYGPRVTRGILSFRHSQIWSGPDRVRYSEMT
jgi:hypothetical protein